MGITLSTLGAVFAPLQGLFGWSAPRVSRAQLSPQARLAVPHAIAGRPRTKPAMPRPCEKARKPLRVVRVVEHSAAPTSAGRMFISGRMSDVCAELDRLAALETAAG